MRSERFAIRAGRLGEGIQVTNAVRLVAALSRLVPYDAAWRWQTATAAEVAIGASEALALLQHAPVYTFGRQVRPEHVLVDPLDLQWRGATIVECDRGGDVTFHGPGQLVAYPILDLRKRRLGPSEYVRRLEATVIQTLTRFDVRGERWAGRPGVWVDGAKVAAIGVRIRRGISSHGLALNVESDLAWFKAIVPCGISDAGVASLAQILGSSPGMPDVVRAFEGAFSEVFDCELVAMTPSPLGKEDWGEPMTPSPLAGEGWGEGDLPLDGDGGGQAPTLPAHGGSIPGSAVLVP